MQDPSAQPARLSPAQAPDRPRAVHGWAWSWAQLLRVPNLPTVPGPPVTGFLLARGAFCPSGLIGLVMPVGVTVALYLAGLISNDLFDLPEDRRERPDRPLPAGRIPLSAAVALAAALLAGALVWAWSTGPWPGAMASGLAGCLLAYNAGAKRVPLLGPALMGSCRGLSLMLGAVTASANWQTLAGLPLRGAVVLALYVAAVTVLAAGETQHRNLGYMRWLPPTVMAGGLLLFRLDGAHQFDHALGGLAASTSLALLALIWVAWTVNRAGPKPPPRLAQRTIGRLLRGLIFLQASQVAVAGPAGLVAAGGLLALFPLASWLGRRFYAS